MKFDPRAVAATVTTALACVAILGFIAWSRFDPAACAKGETFCLVGVLAAIGIVEIYTKEGRCIGAGC